MSDLDKVFDQQAKQTTNDLPNPGTWGHVQGMGQVFIPEKQFPHCPEDHYVRLVHGSRYIIAVFTANHECVGWVVKE